MGEDSVSIFFIGCSVGVIAHTLVCLLLDIFRSRKPSEERVLRQRVVIMEKQVEMYRRQLAEIPQRDRDIEALRSARRLVRRHNSDTEAIAPVIMRLVKTQKSIQQEV